MLSGGEEGVLVLWQLETNRHQFLPRIGGSICDITVSPNERRFAIGLESNLIRIVDSIDNKIVGTIEGIGYCHKLQPFPMLEQHCIYNPKNTNVVILPSKPGSIQFYNLKKDESNGIMDVMTYPLISRMNEKQPDRYVVEFIAFNRNGTRLVTGVRRTTRSILGLDEHLSHLVLSFYFILFFLNTHKKTTICILFLIALLKKNKRTHNTC